MESRLEISFGKVTNRERRHPDEETSGHLGASGKEASGTRGSRAPIRRAAREFLGLLTILGRLALGPGPVWALGLGRLARGTEPESMVPTVSVVTGEQKLLSLSQVFHLILTFNRQRASELVVCQRKNLERS